MSRLNKLVSIGSIVLLTGCAEKTTSFASTMGRVDPATAQTASANLTPEEQILIEQANALDEMSREIIRNATLRGAGIGAAAGCGLALISASSASHCVGGAVIGGVVGGVAGNAIGQKRVADRVQIVSRDDAARAISRTSARVGSLKSRLHTVLAAQEKELSDMRQKVQAGQLPQSALDARTKAVMETRAALGEALVMSARRAAQARKLLLEAKGKGQTNLNWHIEATQELESDALSARSAIGLI